VKKGVEKDEKVREKGAEKGERGDKREAILVLKDLQFPRA
jgi:hypothetical protein